MPEFLTEELKDYIESLYGVNEDDRIFPISKSYLHLVNIANDNRNAVELIQIVVSDVIVFKSKSRNWEWTL